ncbi:hypothetical protein Barb4_04475 [Bacteroidales bacterium Barb4]|nr:hypothetical protein Barb4_04475 [Bacteroidales bacterium Barb4]
MMLFIRDRLRFHCFPVVMDIDAVAFCRRYCAVFGRQTHLIRVYGKMRLNDHVLAYRKRIGILL